MLGDIYATLYKLLRNKITESYLAVGHSVSVVEAGAEVLRAGRLSLGMMRSVIGRRRLMAPVSECKNEIRYFTRSCFF